MAEKTEKATPRKRQEARKKGQIAKSNELGAALSLLGFLIVIRYAGGYMLQKTMDIFRYGFTLAGRPTLEQQGMGDLFASSISSFAALVFPVIAMSVVLAMVLGIAQSRFLLTGYPLSPKFNRISPLNGFKRLFSRRALFELIKSLIKLGILGYVAWTTLRNLQPSMTGLIDMDFRGMLSVVGSGAWRLLINVAITYLIIAIIDYWFQRKEHERELRMSKQEIKEEMKLHEGDPMIKARIRSRQRQMAFNRMIQEVPQADVIITNPVHLAIALKYDDTDMGAPRVVAKGQRLVAERIKEIARNNDVPIVEDPPLAQSLYAMVEVGGEVPFDLYRAVAEVLAMIYRIKQRTA